MSILQVAGFDDGLIAPFVQIQQGNTAIAVTTNARTGSHAMMLGGSGTPIARVNWPVNLTTGWVYFGVFPRILPPVAGTNGQYFQIQDNGTMQVQLYLRSDGRFDLYGGAGTVVATGSYVFPPNVWGHAAVKFTIANSGGIVQVRCNGLPTNDINYTGDTQASANAFANQFQTLVHGFSMGDAPDLLRIDDYILQDATGSAPENDWLPGGDIGLYPIRVTADEAATGYTAGGTAPASTLWQSVDDPTSDELVTTIDDTGTVGDFASFEMGDLPVDVTTIHAFVAQLRAMKSDAGARSIAARWKLGATVALSGDLALSTTLNTYQGIFHRDPNGATITRANVNASKLGVKLSV
jgi:hypothetical protein